jgi:hypothetical protein
MRGAKTISELNKRTGLLFPNPTDEAITTPKGKRKGDAITLDYAGFYTAKEVTIAANLVNEEEQRLNKEESQKGFMKLKEEILTSNQEKKKKDVTDFFALIGAALLIFELIYLKIRGDF